MKYIIYFLIMHYAHLDLRVKFDKDFRAYYTDYIYNFFLYFQSHATWKPGI